MTETFEGFVYKRTKVKGYDLPFGNRYEFTALIFDTNMIGHKFNFPVDFNQKVKVGNRIRIVMESMRKNRLPDSTHIIIIREKDEVSDLGKALIADPIVDYRFFGGYITLPWKSMVNIHNPKMIETDGVDIIRIPLDLVDVREDYMCSDFHVKGIRVLGKIVVKEIVSVEPKTTLKTWEEKLSRVWFTEKGITLRRMGRSIFIPSEILPFPTTDALNNWRKNIVGNIKVTMLYRLKVRWNTARDEEEMRWEPVAPDKIEFTDSASIKQIMRYVSDN